MVLISVSRFVQAPRDTEIACCLQVFLRTFVFQKDFCLSINKHFVFCSFIYRRHSVPASFHRRLKRRNVKLPTFLHIVKVNQSRYKPAMAQRVPGS